MKDASNNLPGAESALAGNTALQKKETENGAEEKESSENPLREELMGSVRYFFLNCPFEEAKLFLWNLYTGWVHHYDDLEGREHSATLMFYECMLELIKELHEIDEEYLLNEP